LEKKEMKRFIFSLVFLALSLALFAPVNADVFGVQDFVDETIHFPGWAIMSTTDANGVPDFGNGYENDFTAATVTFDVTEGRGDWKLDTMEFFYGAGSGSPGSIWDSLYPGDLFLSFSGEFPGASDYWTHVVKLPDSRSGDYPDVNKGNYPVYALGTARPIVNDPATVAYLLASGSGYRRGHPYAVKASDLTGTPVGYADFGGWDKPAGAGDIKSSLFTFVNGGGINLAVAPGDTQFLKFGWTAMCANDVMMATAVIPGSEIPEPGTLLLLGTGLIGLVVRRRHR
jgi:hypothetical protein